MSTTQKTSRAFQLGRLSMLQEILEATLNDEEMPSSFFRTLDYYETEIRNTIVREYPEQHLASNN